MKFLNDLASQGTYEETLRLDADLRAAYKALCRSLQAYGSKAGAASPPSRFEISVVDFPSYIDTSVPSTSHFSAPHCMKRPMHTQEGGGRDVTQNLVLGVPQRGSTPWRAQVRGELAPRERGDLERLMTLRAL